MKQAKTCEKWRSTTCENFFPFEYIKKPLNQLFLCVKNWPIHFPKTNPNACELSNNEDGSWVRIPIFWAGPQVRIIQITWVAGPPKSKNLVSIPVVVGGLPQGIWGHG